MKVSDIFVYLLLIIYIFSTRFYKPHSSSVLYHYLLKQCLAYRRYSGHNFLNAWVNEWGWGDVGWQRGFWGPSDIYVVPSCSGHCQCPVQIFSILAFWTWVPLSQLLHASPLTPTPFFRRQSLGYSLKEQECLEVSSWGGLQCLIDWGGIMNG